MDEQPLCSSARAGWQKQRFFLGAAETTVPLTRTALLLGATQEKVTLQDLKDAPKLFNVETFTGDDFSAEAVGQVRRLSSFLSCLFTRRFA